MRLKKAIFYFIIIFSIFLIYKVAFKNEVNYVSLGDFLAEGINPYGEIDYGFSDYLADYYRSKNILGFYINEFSNKNYTIENLIDDIYNNKTIISGNNKYNIRKILRESTLVTISIGANDIMNSINYKDLDNKQLLKDKIDSISKRLDTAIKLVKKYAKKDIVLLGYYNPYEMDLNEFNDLVNYIDQKYNEISLSNNIKFISIKKDLNEKKKCFPNPGSIYPSTYGSMKIFEQVKKQLQK